MFYLVLRLSIDSLWFATKFAGQSLEWRCLRWEFDDFLVLSCVSAVSYMNLISVLNSLVKSASLFQFECTFPRSISYSVEMFQHLYIISSWSILAIYPPLWLGTERLVYIISGLKRKLHLLMPFVWRALFMLKPFSVTLLL